MAQNMNNPYSAYGLGDIDGRVFNFNAGMGYTGIALPTNLTSTGNNPASIAGMQKSLFRFDVSTTGRIATYHGDVINANNNVNRDFTINALSMATRFNKIWSGSIGFRPYSRVNYQFQANKVIEGSMETYPSTYKGHGGLNEYYWTNGFSLGKHIMLGIDASYIAGSVNQDESLLTYTSSIRDYYAGARVSGGLIYQTALNKNWDLSLGLKYKPSIKLGAERTLTVLNDTTAMTDHELVQTSKYALPEEYGAGIALRSKKGNTFAADYVRTNWSDLNQRGQGWRLVDAQWLSVGAEFARDVRNWKNVVLRRSFSVGAFDRNTNLMVNGYQINEWGLTAGLSRTLRSGFVVAASVEGGMRGTTNNGLIKENFFQFNLNFSYRDVFLPRAARFGE